MQDASAEDVREAWLPIENGINATWSILVDGSNLSFDVNDWMKVYTSHHNWLIKGPGKASTSCSDHDKDVLYDSICKNIREFVHKKQQEIEKLQGEVFLRTYLQRYENTRVASLRIARLTSYLEKFYLQQNTAKKNIPVLTDWVWYESVWCPLSKRLLDDLFTIVDNGRQGEMWDKTLLGRTKDMLLHIGTSLVVGTTPVGKPDTPYMEQLLQPYIQRTTEFYLKESTAFLQTNSVVDYLRLVDRRLEEETTLASQHLHPSSLEMAVQACEKVLISDHIDTLKGEFKKMLQNEREDDMRFFFKILRRVPDGLKESAITLGEKLESEGKALVSAQAALLTDKKSQANSTELIHHLVNLHTKYCGIVKRCFEDELIFQQAMDKAFVKIVNSDVGIFSMPEILNFFIDKQLKDKKLEETAIDTAFDSIVSLVVYLNDKDIFEKACNRSLSKRLLSGKFVENRESSFITKLKHRCGDATTRVMEDMINDIRVSDERTSEFQAWMKENYPQVPQSVAIKVLNSHRWSTLSKVDIQLQEEWIPLITGFEKWYATVFPQRRLNWNFAHGQVTMSVNYTEKGRSRHCEIQVTVLQASVLMLFNDNQTLSFEDISQRLAITSPDLLCSAIAPLVYFKIPMLTRKPASTGDEDEQEEGSKKPAGKEEEVIRPTDVFQLKPLTKAPPKARFAYPPTTATAVKKEASDGKAKAMEERNTKMDLALVRIMKARNVCTYNELLAEVVKQLAGSFVAEPRAIRGRIDSLIERGYMSRDESDFTKFRYIA